VSAEGPDHRTIPYRKALRSSETLPAIGWRCTHRDEMNLRKREIVLRETAKFVDH
jgi:hypothetical protein